MFENNADRMSSVLAHPDDASLVNAYEDPVVQVSALREHGPIVPGVGVRFGNLVLPNLMVPASKLSERSHAVVGWDAAQAVYRSRDLTSGWLQETLGKLWGPSIGLMDSPEHARYRGVMQRGFTPTAVMQWEEKFVNPMLRARFKALRPLGKADLASVMTAFYPYEILCQIAGFEAADIGYIADLFHRINTIQVDPATSIAASEELKAYALDLVNRRRADPTDDYVSSMLAAEVRGEPLDDEHAVAFVIHFLSGGLDTVFRMSNNLTYLLLQNPDQAAILRSDRSLIPNAVDEAMRFEGVSNMMARQAQCDLEILGYPIKRGEMVHLVHAAINRDPSRWDNPNKFDVTRERQENMAFGFGPHRCLGMHLARKELALYLNLLLDELPGLAWDPSLPTLPRISGWFMRSCLTLPVVWDA